MAEWRHASYGFVPSDAVSGGHDVSGELIYVGRTHESGDLIPGKIVPSHGVLYVPYGKLILERTILKQSSYRQPELFLKVVKKRRTVNTNTWFDQRMVPLIGFLRAMAKSLLEVSWLAIPLAARPCSLAERTTMARGSLEKCTNRTGYYLFTEHCPDNDNYNYLSFKVLYIPFGGREISISDYELLVIQY